MKRRFPARAVYGRARDRHSAQGAQRGFSLVEVVITVTLLTALTLGSLLVIVPVARQARLNREIDIANAQARVVLEKVQAAPFHTIPTLYPDGLSLPIAGLSGGAATVDYVDPTADPLVLQVTVSWSGQDGGTYSRTFTTVRTE